MPPFNDQERALIAANALAVVLGLVSMRFRQYDLTGNGDGTKWAEWMYGSSLVCLVAIFIAALWRDIAVPPPLCTIALVLSLAAALVSYLLHCRYGSWVTPNALFCLILANAIALTATGHPLSQATP